MNILNIQHMRYHNSSCEEIWPNPSVIMCRKWRHTVIKSWSLNNHDFLKTYWFLKPDGIKLNIVNFRRIKHRAPE